MKAGSLHSARGRYENDCMKYESLNIEYKSPTIVLYGIWLTPSVPCMIYKYNECCQLMVVFDYCFLACPIILSTFYKIFHITSFKISSIRSQVVNWILRFLINDCVFIYSYVIRNLHITNFFAYGIKTVNFNNPNGL